MSDKTETATEHIQRDFAAALKKWRGSRTQKEAAALLQVPLRTFQGWESGRPASKLTIAAITARMAALPEPETKAP